MMDPNTIADLLGTWGYPALLLLLLLTGIGSPIPEDLLLLSAGYLIAADVFKWPITLVICGAGVVASDVMLYSAGRHLAWQSTRRPAGRLLSPERLRRGTRWFAKLGNRVILLARLTPGTRILVFMTAGAHAVPLKSFIRWNVPGTVIWVPLMLFAGHFAGTRLDDFNDILPWTRQISPWVLGYATGLVLIWLWRR